MTRETRYSPIYAPNSLVIARSMSASQVGLNILQNGGAASDAAVAALAVDIATLVLSRPWHLSGMLMESFDSTPRAFSGRGETQMDLFGIFQELLRAYGTRSLMDLVPGLSENQGSWEEMVALDTKNARDETLGWRKQAGTVCNDGSSEQTTVFGSTSFAAGMNALHLEASESIEAEHLLDLVVELASDDDIEPGAEILQVMAVDHRGMAVTAAICPSAGQAEDSQIIVQARESTLLGVATAGGAGTLAAVLMPGKNGGPTRTSVARLAGNPINLQARVERPRYRLTRKGGRVLATVEESVAPEVIEWFTNRGWEIKTVPRWSNLVGAVQMIQIDRRHGLLVGAVDPRGSSHAAGY